MEIEFLDGGRTIRFDKEINELDKLVLEFAGVLEKHHARYVIISGYIAILFGRSRSTEDVDLFIEKLDKDKVDLILKGFEGSGWWIINSDAENAFELLKDGLAIRVAKADTVTPNFEVKFPKKPLDFESLSERLKVILPGGFLYTSPLESQIAFKLYLGGDKDFEDARHLFNTFKDHLDLDKLKRYVIEFRVVEAAKKELSGLYG